MSGAHIGPHPLVTRNNKKHESEAALSPSMINPIWILARQTEVHVTSWTGFNIRFRDEEPIFEDVVGYLPTINASATELNTVFEILNQSELIRKDLLLSAIVVVMDQALYAKATNILWNIT